VCSSDLVVILTAAYILWTLQRVYLGSEYKGPHGNHLYPMTTREKLIGAPLLAFAILFGVYPQALLQYMTPTINHQVDALADWTRDVKDKRTASEEMADAKMEVTQLEQ
jgi:NADH-quinone oxidoreductase subunit M